jgi:hypothetical protein
MITVRQERLADRDALGRDPPPTGFEPRTQSVSGCVVMHH